MSQKNKIKNSLPVQGRSKLLRGTTLIHRMPGGLLPLGSSCNGNGPARSSRAARKWRCAGLGPRGSHRFPSRLGGHGTWASSSPDILSLFHFITDFSSVKGSRLEIFPGRSPLLFVKGARQRGAPPGLLVPFLFSPEERTPYSVIPGQTPSGCPPGPHPCGRAHPGCPARR